MSVQAEVQNKSPAYHILAEVDPNQDEFIVSDRRATENRFSSTFFRDSVSEDIFEAIARKTTTGTKEGNESISVSKLKNMCF